jgi:hypothetical protein
MRPQLRVFEYDFSLLVKYCQITMRFPCSFSLSWKLGTKCSHTEKSTVCDNRKVSLTSNRVEFNSTLRLRAQLPEDGGSCLDKKVRQCSHSELPHSQPELGQQTRRRQGGGRRHHRTLEAHQ